jgi:rsbT co-antagonist protein RsbR
MTNAPETPDELLVYCPEMIFVAAENGAIIRASSALERGLSDELQKGARLHDLVHAQEKSVFDAAWARASNAADPATFRSRLRTSSGAYQAFLVTLRKGPDGRDVVYGSLRPEDRRAKLRTQVSLLQSIIENVPICVWAIDTEGVFTYHDGKGLELAGVKAGQFLGMNAFEVYAESPDNFTHVRAALAGETQHHISYDNHQWWENWELPVRDEEGDVSAVVGVTLNITDTKRVEEELRSKLALIQQQQEVIRALSTPIIQVWDNVLTLPMVGVLDSARAAEVMHNLLSEVVRTRARFAILDLTGVDAIDTATASHLLSLVRAIKLLGAEGIVTGMRPAIAQTVVGLGVDLSGIILLSTLREGLKLCMRRMGASA